MYVNILKKDLKRKKTMNIILLLFIILATTFVSSSVNNVLAVTTALDNFFEKAEMPDYLIATMNKNGGNATSEMLDNIEDVDSYGIENIIFMSSDNLYHNGEKFEKLSSSSILFNINDAKINYFDSENQIINEVEEGTVLLSQKIMNKYDIQVGDTFEITINGISEEFEVAGGCKDAPFGSDMMGMARFLINEEDYKKFDVAEVTSLLGGSLCYINTNDVDALEKELSEQDNGIIFNGSKELIKATYSMDMIVAGVLLIVSICLIIVSFIILNFTITFTLSEEFREIGVMKAIGISNLKIRGLYMMKYLALALIGVIIGFFTSIPFANMMLESVSDSMVISTDNSYIINIICSVAVISIILLFCFICTGKAKKFTPVDAIRNGETGKRYNKKGLFNLNKSPLKPSLFLSVNDVLSNPKRFGTIILTFTVCLSLVLVLVNSVNTLQSENILPICSVSISDVYLANDGEHMKCMVEDGREILEESLDEMEQKLADNGMPAKCSNEIMMKLSIKHGDNVCKSQVFQGIRTTTDQYVYNEGTAPQSENEIAITNMIAEKLDAQIGDTVTISQLEGEKEYIITALYQSMNNFGEGVRFHEDVEASFLQASGFFAYQIDFTDNPDDAEIERRAEKIKELYDTDKVYTSTEYADDMTGAGSMINSVRMLVLVVSLIIIVLITVLMERSFITKERGEIALLKAIGFTNGKIISWHTLRFVIVAIISAIISLATIIPLTSLALNPIFNMMGANYGIEYNIVPLEVYVVYPLIVLTTTLVSAFITSQHIRTISSSEISGIE